MTETLDFSGRLIMRPLRGDLAEGMFVSRWRNTPEAQAGFFTKGYITPDMHRQFVQSKPDWDHVWIAETRNGKPVGMGAVNDQTREVGRYLVDPDCRGQGYAQEIDWMTLEYAFVLAGLPDVWADVIEGNEAILSVHGKMGYRVAGIDLPGHVHPGFRVLHLVYDWATWEANRAAMRERFVLGGRLR